MSGSSLDGLDIAHVQLEEVRGKWSYQILNCACVPYSKEWTELLRRATTTSVADFLRLHSRYGHYLGGQVNKFIEEKGIAHQVHFISSHGHTVFHEPGNQATFQLGEGAAIAAVTGLPVINDLRAVDVALGGQGAPIVPIGDKMLFGEYDYQLNIGGIANVTVWQGSEPLAFDICPANQVLNTLAQRAGKEMDEDGHMAAAGNLLHGVLDEWNKAAYYSKLPPKSLSNEQAIDIAFPALLEGDHSIEDMLHTASVGIAFQIADAISKFPHGKEEGSILVTGGGALNQFLITELRYALGQLGIKTIIPSVEVIQYKEALVMALIGTLRWREEVNVLSSVTGSTKDSIGGALWVI